MSYQVFRSLTSLLPFSHSTPATLAFLLFRERAKHITASEPLQCLFLLPGKLFHTDSHMANSPTFFKSLFKCHLLNEAYLNHPIYNCKLHLSFLFP